MFEILDHSAIYYFIAGSYTPFLFIAVQGWEGWTLFGIVWGLAIGGTIFKVFFVRKFLFLSTLLYVIMGWLVVLVWKPLTENFSTRWINVINHRWSMLYRWSGFLCMEEGFKYSHAIWHYFVLAGSILHFFSVLLYLLPY